MRNFVFETGICAVTVVRSVGPVASVRIELLAPETQSVKILEIV